LELTVSQKQTFKFNKESPPVIHYPDPESEKPGYPDYYPFLGSYEVEVNKTMEAGLQTKEVIAASGGRVHADLKTVISHAGLPVKTSSRCISSLSL
jgi:hypothetical protein